MLEEIEVVLVEARAEEFVRVVTIEMLLATEIEVVDCKTEEETLIEAVLDDVLEIESIELVVRGLSNCVEEIGEEGVVPEMLPPEAGPVVVLFLKGAIAVTAPSLPLVTEVIPVPVTSPPEA